MLNHDDQNVETQLDEQVENHTDTIECLPSLSSEETSIKQPSLLEEFQLGLKENAIEQLKIMATMINQKMTDIRIAIFVIWYTKAYLNLRDSFKSYVENELTITYHAATRQVAAAYYANKLFGYKKIGFFSDSSMLTIGRLPFRLQVLVVKKIAEKNNVKPNMLGRAQLTKKLIESTASVYLDKANLRKLSAFVDTENEDQAAGALDKDLEIDFESQPLQSSDAIKDDNGKCVWDDNYDPFYDYLAEITDADQLAKEIFGNCSLVMLLNHIEMYKNDQYEYCSLLFKEDPRRLFQHVYDLYESALTQLDKNLKSENDDDEVDFEEETDQLEELEKNYPEPSSTNEKQSYISERRKLVGRIQSIAEKTRVETHPKLAVINAVIAILEPDDLAYLLAKCSNILNQNEINYSNLDDDDTVPGLDDGEVFSVDFDGIEG